jgi:hypothetical protein
MFLLQNVGARRGRGQHLRPRPLRAGEQDERDEDGQDGAGLLESHHPLQPRY